MRKSHFFTLINVQFYTTMNWDYFTLINGQIIDPETNQRAFQDLDQPYFNTIEEAEQWMIDKDYRGSIQ